MVLDVKDDETLRLLGYYLDRLQLATEALRVTTDRATFQRWLGRRIAAGVGGAYVFLPAPGEHAILINLPRIDRSQPRSLEVVVAEELLHMRDHLDGDFRRHAKHGYDRIARRVAALTGATADEVRGAVKRGERRQPRFEYACPACNMRIFRRVRGTWACGRCSPVFDPRFQLRLIRDAGSSSGSGGG
jgi:predicted SprT family Zn-dependent metalloprotease